MGRSTRIPTGATDRSSMNRALRTIEASTASTASKAGGSAPGRHVIVRAKPPSAVGFALARAMSAVTWLKRAMRPRASRNVGLARKACPRGMEGGRPDEP